MSDAEYTYTGGFARLAPDRNSKKFSPYEGMDSLLAEMTQNGITPLLNQILPNAKFQKTSPITATEKLNELMAIFQGQPMALALHGMVVAASRRKHPPIIARDLFLNLWRNHAVFLLEHLDARWKISAIQTFETFGETEAQRMCGAQLSVFFSTIKLYESERLYSRHAPDVPFHLNGASDGPLPFDMHPYSLLKGDLDRNLLGQLWKSAEADPVLRPLACHMLLQVNRADNILFRRFAIMKKTRRERIAARRSKQP